MWNNNWRDSTSNRKPPVETGRDSIALTKYPTDLDFSTTIAGTEYIVSSQFNKEADECIVAKVARMALHKEK